MGHPDSSGLFAFGNGSGDRGIEGVEEGAGFCEDVFGFGGGEGPAEGALRGELGSAFGVAADELRGNVPRTTFRGTTVDTGSYAFLSCIVGAVTRLSYKTSILLS
jgi:hypothetical protein